MHTFPQHRRFALQCKALGHETRVRIVCELAKKPCTLEEIAEKVGLSEPGASKHVRILITAGFVSGRRRKSHVIFFLMPSAKKTGHVWQGIVRDNVFEE